MSCVSGVEWSGVEWNAGRSHELRFGDHESVDEFGDDETETASVNESL